ncbi:MAG: F0F1 ATP synthase subunit gamma, partial [Phycisphaeraceae bacterium JB051]
EGVEGEVSKSQVDYEYSPEPEQLLAELLPVTVKTQLFQSFNESEVSEQIARMVAMKAATDNATQMSKDLTRVYNRARQSAITTELTEVISGAMALG